MAMNGIEQTLASAKASPLGLALLDLEKADGCCAALTEVSFSIELSEGHRLHQTDALNYLCGQLFAHLVALKSHIEEAEAASHE